MAQRSGFFNAELVGGSYDREYLAQNFAEYFSTFVGNGVFAQPANSLMVTAAEGMKVSIKEGKAWINGYYFINTAPEQIELSLNLGSYPRIDSVVLRLDLNTRVIELAVVKGAAASAPTAPALTRNSNVYEIGLANIMVRNGVSSIVAENITDTRQNKEVCGIVSGVIDQIDTTDLFNQYNAAFNTWFKTLEDTLDSNVAANLLNKITALESGTTPAGDAKKLDGKLAAEYLTQGGGQLTGELKAVSNNSESNMVRNIKITTIKPDGAAVATNSIVFVRK